MEPPRRERSHVIALIGLCALMFLALAAWSAVRMHRRVQARRDRIEQRRRTAEDLRRLADALGQYAAEGTDYPFTQPYFGPAPSAPPDETRPPASAAPAAAEPREEEP